MQVNKKYIQTFAFLLVYLGAIYFWTQPFQDRKIPYGEYDAMSHFEVGDYMSYNDKSFVKLPPYIDLRYGFDNKFKPHALWYAPPFHTSLGIMQVIGGERVIPVYLLNAIMATFVIVTVYFAMNSLFGFLPAILSSLLIIFSPRDFMPYLWGQWPERFGYAFVPVILYCFYRYFTAYSKEKSESSNPIYIYLTALFLGANILIHPLVFFHSMLAVAVLYVMLAIKQKKFVFNIKHISVCIIIFLILFMSFPYQTFNVFVSFAKDKSSKANNPEYSMLSRIFQWAPDAKDYSGSVPSNYFSFKEMHGMWTLPFLLLGIIFLLWRREEKDLFLLAWLVSLYLVLHRDIFGKAEFLHRSLSASAHIFAPLTAVGAVCIASLIKIPSKYKAYIKYAIAAVFLYLMVTVNAAYASKMLNKNVYNPTTTDGFFTTLNEQEFMAAQWILENAPSSYNISILGIVHYPNFVSSTSKKIRWMAAVSQHINRFYYLLEEDEKPLHLKNDYIIMDYTMIAPLNDKALYDNMAEFEKTTLINRTLIYNQNNIRIYKP